MKPEFKPLLMSMALMFPAVAISQQGEHDMGMHAMHGQNDGATVSVPKPADDTRQLVHYPAAMKAHTLMNMRDHLRTLQKIQQHLAREEFDAAAEIAEQRLGMSSMEMHGAAEAARFMPPGMRAAGGAMHRAASRFARVASDAAVTGEVSGVLEALAELTGGCVACHDGYRLQ